MRDTRRRHILPPPAVGSSAGRSWADDRDWACSYEMSVSGAGSAEMGEAVSAWVRDAERVLPRDAKERRPTPERPEAGERAECGIHLIETRKRGGVDALAEE